MASSPHLSSLINCELKGIDGLDIPSAGGFFIRYYLNAGACRRIRVDTKEISGAGFDPPSWNEKALLQCRTASVDPVGEVLEPHPIQLELRWRRRPQQPPAFGWTARSKLLGRVELSWKEGLGTSGATAERWVCFVPARQTAGGKTPAVLVRVRVSVEKEFSRVRDSPAIWTECRCEQCAWTEGDRDLIVEVLSVLILEKLRDLSTS